ncbi:hypothetical protein LCGC14_2272660 [marine sediment metagenome]|uniref:Uncharacterized protein n=1 Tax=marine sediment metagenome TaxID=412755 RepID=A0A0F9CWN7_9ZZZZ
MAGNGFFDEMGKEATEILTSGKAGTSWREVSPNILIMACFHMLTNHLAHAFLRPMWWFVGAIATGVVGYIVSIILKI